MKLGTTFYERAVPTQNREDHLQFLVESGFQSVEFCVHPRLMPDKETYKLIKTAALNQMEIHFHSPDFLDPQSYGLMHFLNDEKASATYRPYFYNLSELNVNGGNTHKIIFHSIPAETRILNFKALLDQNLRALDNLLNLVAREGFPFEILLENTCPEDEHTLGSNPEFLDQILRSLQGSPFSLCLDLPHWYRTHQPVVTPREDTSYQEVFHDFYQLKPTLIESISYAHLHGFTNDLSKSHLPLKDEQIGFNNFVKAFSLKKDQIIFNLEIFDFENLGNIDSYESLLLQHIKKIENY